ncbi:hypothetical protein BJY01DRAFT_241989 [Aspergillus pseudoustus]|uniref:Uncharacterized protein n=1 Tax=Aspergillus pseudoustus TaxID=1810923 RepID=A0ABR4L066_9EURO
MAAFPRNNSQLLIPDAPEFDELEVRCTWSGEYEELANLRISLEVKCVPNTQLQLLNVRDHDIYLENAYAICLSQSDDHTDNQQEDETPQSPLFGFSPLVVEGDNDIGLNPVLEGYTDGVQISEASPIPKNNIEPLKHIGSSHHDTELHDEEPLSESPSSPFQSARLCPRVPESGPVTKSLKRSATDAELPDSDNEDEIDGVLREITPRNSCQTSPVKSTTAERHSERTIACSTSPRRSDVQRKVGMVVPNENSCPTIPTKTTSAGEMALERLLSSGKSTLEEKTPRKPTKIPKPTFYPESTPPRSSVPTPSIDETERLPEQVVYQSHVAAPDAAVARSITEVLQAPNTTVFTVTTGSKRLREQDLPPSPSRKLETVVKEPESCNNDPAPHYKPRSSEDSSHHNVHSGFGEPEPSDQPEVKLIDGLIILVNSERVHPATFKFTVTVSIYIPFPNEKGWSDLMIPGLPRTGNGKSGFFLFLMPSRHGLELRTTNVKRAKLVENCFIAQFVNSGNLVVPMRRCDRRYCGDVTDFTVDQEVIAHSVVKATINYQNGREKFELRFNVMFSVRLHNRCFWTDKCSILLYVDGGPEGSYHCDLSPRKGGLKKIHILANEYAETGVCCLHVTCPPRDLDRLCLTWVLSGTGREAAYWVPRLYSASSASRERTRDSLRHSLMETLSKSTYLFSDARARRVGVAIRSEFARNDDNGEQTFEDAKDHSEDSSSSWTVYTGQLSPVVRAVQLQLIYFAQDPRCFLKWFLIGLVCVSFLGTRAFTSVRPIHHRPQQDLSGAQVGLDVPKQAFQFSQFDPSGEPEYTRHDAAQGISTGNLDELKTFNRYRVVDAGSTQSETSVEASREHDELDRGVKIKGDANGKPPNSVRDTIDYWLGWMGPIE